MERVTPELPACPACSGGGIARAVMSKAGMRTITYECERCQHKWDVADVERQSLFGGTSDYAKT